MDVTNIETVEWDRVGVVARGLGVANLAVLFGLGQLSDNWDS